MRPAWPKPADPEMTYVYEQFGTGPVAATDAARHLGAGRLTYDPDRDVLTGDYWTQRRADARFNPAGTIVAKRKPFEA